MATHHSVLAQRILMDREAWRATVHGVAKSRTRLSDSAQHSTELFLLLFSAQRSSLSSCCKAGLVVLNSFNFCLSVKLLISPSNLKETFAGWSILVCRFFPFVTLNILCHSLLACRVSVEKSADNLMGILLCVICCFSLLIF